MAHRFLVNALTHCAMLLRNNYMGIQKKILKNLYLVFIGFFFIVWRHNMEDVSHTTLNILYSTVALSQMNNIDKKVTKWYSWKVFSYNSEVYNAVLWHLVVNVTLCDSWYLLKRSKLNKKNMVTCYKKYSDGIWFYPTCVF